jgi:hypothetical protein
MAESNGFYITKGSVSLADDGLVMRLTYPTNPKKIHERIPENLQFGIEVYQRLLEEGHAPIADEQNPVRSPSAGSAYLFSDGRMVINRRDMSAPTHKKYHSAYAGFPDSSEAAGLSESIVQTVLRESAEEGLLVTRDKNPWLIVPTDSADYTLESARRLGLELPKRYVNAEWEEPTDKLEVYDEQGNLLFTHKALLDIIFESETSINALHLRRIPLSSEEVYPVDSEGIMEGNRFIHFNRESYIINPDMANVKFGDIMKNPLVFQTRIKNGKPEVYTPEYNEPFYGPDGIKVVNPHVWAPDNLVTRYLHALNIAGYNWINMELWKEQTKLKGKSLVPTEVLAEK